MAETVPSAEASTEAKNALAVPAFRSFWINGVTFFMVTNALRFVYGWVVLDGLDRGEAAQGFVVFVLGLPAIFVMLPAGVWADRTDPKQLLLGSQVALIAVMVATAVAIGDGAGSMPLLVGSALVAGVVSALGGPVRQSLIPALLKPAQLFNGIALNALAMTLSMVLGAVLARQFGEWFGFDGAFWWMAGLLGFGIVALVAMPSPGAAAKGDATTMRMAIGEGMRFVWDHTAIRTLFWLLGVAGFAISPVMFVTIQAHVKSELGRSSADVAPVLALMGLGIAITSVFIMRQGDMPRKGQRFMWAMMCGTANITLMGFTTAYWQILTLGFTMGLCGGFFINMNQGLIQSQTPQDVMGRVMGLYALVQLGFTPFGAALVGVIAEAIGTGPAITVAGATGLICVSATYVRATALRGMV